MKKIVFYRDEREVEKLIRDLDRNFPATARSLLQDLGLTHLIRADYSDCNESQKRGEEK